MNHIALVVLMSVVSVITPAFAGSWSEFAVSSWPENQERPDVDGLKIVWQEVVEGDWDVFFVDLGAAEPVVTDLTLDYSDQQNPAIYGNRVVWQHLFVPEQGEPDWDVRLTDLTDPGNPVEIEVAAYVEDQTSPAIFGDVVVWQNEYIDPDTTESDMDIWGANVDDIENAFEIAVYPDNQQSPAIFHNTVVWQDNGAFSGSSDWDIWSADILDPTDHDVSYSPWDQEYPSIWGNIVAWQENIDGDWQIYAADISNPHAPVEFPVCLAPSLQTNPDVGDNLIVWQDFRNGKDWDIYGYNLTTGREFRITNNAADQTHPAVSGNFVVWQGNRSGTWNIYAAELTGPEVARCTDRPAGDLNNDCVVNLADLAQIAADWLVCGFDEPAACP